jgi:nucleotide-binding universal stress UspA family protein
MDQIIVGFDGSEASQAALTWAVAEACLHHARVVAWTVLDQHSRFPADPPTDLAQTRQRMKPIIDEIIGGFPTEHRVGHGQVATELIGACGAADLLVVGSRGHNPLVNLLLGSVSRACLHAAPCPVVVVRPEPSPAPPRHRVIVGIDASPYARHALAVAAGEAKLRHAALHAVHAVSWDYLRAELIKPTTRQLVAWGKHLVDTEITRTGVAARPVIVPGHAPDVLVRHSARADLLVLGSRGHNPVATLLIGSTTDYCARHAHCPVMIVRSGAA